jgi:hypothetical protein
MEPWFQYRFSDQVADAHWDLPLFSSLRRDWIFAGRGQRAV